MYTHYDMTDNGFQLVAERHNVTIYQHNDFPSTTIETKHHSVIIFTPVCGEIREYSLSQHCEDFDITLQIALEVVVRNLYINNKPRTPHRITDND